MVRETVDEAPGGGATATAGSQRIELVTKGRGWRSADRVIQLLSWRLCPSVLRLTGLGSKNACQAAATDSNDPGHMDT